MGAPIDLLYRLTDRDRAFPHWKPFHSFVRRTLSNVVITTSLANWDDLDNRPPDGTLLFITSMQLEVNPGSTASALQVDLFLVNRNTNAGAGILSRDDGVAVAFPNRMILQSPFDFAIRMDREYLTATGTFSAANVSNYVQFSMQGYVMPEGTLA